MDSGYEEYERLHAKIIPGQKEGLDELGQALLCASLIMYQFSLLEMALDEKLITSTRSDWNYQRVIWPELGFQSKIRMLQTICDKHTLRVQRKVIGRDIAQELKDSKLIEHLTRCNTFRIRIAHGVWMGIALPENAEAYFQLLYKGETVKWKLSYLTQILAIIMGVSGKLRAFNASQFP